MTEHQVYFEGQDLLVFGIFYPGEHMVLDYDDSYAGSDPCFDIRHIFDENGADIKGEFSSKKLCQIEFQILDLFN